MKYLDEEIVSTVSGLTIPSSGVYPYYICNGSTILFAGNVFIQANTSTCYISMNDVLESLKSDGSEIALPLTNQTVSEEVFGKYYAKVNGVSGETIDVALIYRYPNRNTEMETGLKELSTLNSLCNCLQGTIEDVPKLLPHFPAISSTEYPLAARLEVLPANQYANVVYTDFGLVGKNVAPKWTIALYKNDTAVVRKLSDFLSNMEPAQDFEYDVEELANFYQQTEGTYYTNDTGGNMILKIKDSNGNQISQALLTTVERTYSFTWTDATNNYIRIYVGDTTTAYIELYGNWYHKELKCTFRAYRDSMSMGGRIYVKNIKFTWGDKDADGTYIKMGDNLILGELDTDCMSKYYLMWQDRFGGYQSQPFEKISTFSEDFTREYVSNYRREKRVSNVTVKPKWEIQTNWLDEELYPYYESIFVSPRLILFDTENNHGYNVNVTDSSYTQKTNENQRKLFNLKLSLEQNKTQIVKY